MRRLLLTLACFALSCVAPWARAGSAPQPARVMIVGTWHFSSPGRDIHNMKSDDMLSAQRQQEIEAASESLAIFAPTVVAVEWPSDVTDTHYTAYRKGELPASALRNEVAQLGFRMAAARNLDRVHGIDMAGEFPMETVAAWADRNGKGDDFAALMQRAGIAVAASGTMLESHSVGAVLRHLNTPRLIAQGQALYLELLRYGAGAAQPGAELNAAWQRRNYLICARLLQILAPSDRAVVYFGQGHAHALRRCVVEAPGVELVEPNDYLPQ